MPKPSNGTKRGRGTGSVRQKRRGVWQVRWEEGVGRARRYRSTTVHGTKRQAEEVLRTSLIERDRLRTVGVTHDPNLTLADWLDHWLKYIAEPNLRPTTVKGYREVIERCLAPTGKRTARSKDNRECCVPRLADLPLRKLSVADVQAWVADHADRPYVLASHRKVLRAALSEAERRELIVRNPAKLVRVPQPPRREVEPLTPEQAQAFLAGIEGDRNEALYHTTMALGLRQGEVLGLRWEDIDLDAGELTVRHTLHRHEGVYQLYPPKTERSRRTLPLPPPLVETLRAHRATQVRERLSAPEWAEEWDLVFCGRTGRPMDGKSLTAGFQRKLARLGLPKVRFHDLRHGAATYLLRAGVPMRNVMEILGHSEMATTSDIYSHVLPEAKREAVDKVSDLLFGT